jgi:hypothetical protein
MPNADSVIEKAELREALPGDGYEWLVENEGDHLDEEPETIFNWLRGNAPWRRGVPE